MLDELIVVRIRVNVSPIGLADIISSNGTDTPKKLMLLVVLLLRKSPCHLEPNHPMPSTEI